MGAKLAKLTRSAPEGDDPIEAAEWQEYMTREQVRIVCPSIPAETVDALPFQVCKSMDDNCGEWVECMGVASGCGEQEVGVASGSGWNLWVWLVGVGGIYGCGYWVWL